MDVLISERGKITRVQVPKFDEKVGEKSNKELLQLTGLDLCRIPMGNGNRNR